MANPLHLSHLQVVVQRACHICRENANFFVHLIKKARLAQVL